MKIKKGIQVYISEEMHRKIAWANLPEEKVTFKVTSISKDVDGNVIGVMICFPYPGQPKRQREKASIYVRVGHFSKRPFDEIFAGDEVELIEGYVIATTPTGEIHIQIGQNGDLRRMSVPKKYVRVIR